MPVLPLDCHLPTHTIKLSANEQTTKETTVINNSYIYIYISHVNVTQTVPDISSLMPMHQGPLLVKSYILVIRSVNSSSRICWHADARLTRISHVLLYMYVLVVKSVHQAQVYVHIVKFTYFSPVCHLHSVNYHCFCDGILFLATTKCTNSN